MPDSANLKVLFIAGFGPMVRDTGESRELYRDFLGIPFKEEPDGYLHSYREPDGSSATGREGGILLRRGTCWS